MTPEEKATIKAEIERRIKETEKASITLKKQTEPVPPSVAIGRLTRMDAIQQKNMAESNLKTNKALIANLKEALEKLDDDDFGICAMCNKPIPLGRILSVPDAKVCVPCISKKKR